MVLDEQEDLLMCFRFIGDLNALNDGGAFEQRFKGIYGK